MLTRLPFRRWEIGLDPATPDSTTLGALRLTGWAFHRDIPLAGIEISVAGQEPFPVRSGVERPDVATAFPRCEVGRPGFEASIHVLEDPVRLRITLVLGNGQTVTTERKLRRTRAMNDEARGVYGAPDRLAATWPGLLRDLGRYGAIGRDVWQSRRIRGWIRGSGEAAELARASESLGDSPLIVEVGTFLGCSTVLLAGPCKRRGSGRVHCVDSFSHEGSDAAVPVYRAIVGSLGMSMRQAFERNMRRAGLSDWITVHEMPVAEAARKWTAPIDLLFLDGDISDEGSRESFLAWTPFLRGGGILAINGTVEQPKTGACRVVEEFIRPPDYEEIRRVHHMTFARKAAGAGR